MSRPPLHIYLSGQFVPENEARVSVYDRCFLYGDGVFEGIAVWGRAPFRLAPHLKRLAAGLAYLVIDNPHTDAGWTDLIDETIARNDMEDGYLRLQVSRGEGMSSIKWEKRLLRRPEPNVTIIPVPGFKDYYQGLFARKAEQGLAAVMVSRPRISSAAVPSGIKHCNYLNSVIGAIEVTSSGADIGIAVDTQGFVSEGLAYNVFIVSGGRILTAPTSRDILPGVTRAAVIEIARSAGFEVSEEVFDAYALAAADEVFITSTLELCVPVVKVDGRPVGNGRPGPVAGRLGGLLLEAMEREAALYHSQRLKATA